MRYILLTTALSLCAGAFGATGVSPVASGRGRDGRDARGPREARDGRDARGPREARDRRDARGSREARDGRDARGPGEARDRRDARGPGEDFERTLCGTMPKDWWLMNRQLPTNCFRYVSNVQAVSGEKAFLNDFTGQSLAQRAWRGVGHGYLCHALPKASNDVLVIRFCFRLEDGKFSCEVRGPNAGGGSLQIPWWIAVGDTVGIKGNGKRGENPSVSVGPVRPHAWHRVTFRLPTVGSSETEAEVRLERYLGKGRFEPVGKPRRVGFGGMRLTGPYSFLAFTGYGKSRYWIDDFSVTNHGLH